MNWLERIWPKNVFVAQIIGNILGAGPVIGALALFGLKGMLIAFGIEIAVAVLIFLYWLTHPV